jgi:hypothetical protein
MHPCNAVGCDNKASHVCDGCALVTYCGTSCQTSHWKAAHHSQCDEINSILYGPASHEARKAFLALINGDGRPTKKARKNDADMVPLLLMAPDALQIILRYINEDAQRELVTALKLSKFHASDPAIRYIDKLLARIYYMWGDIPVRITSLAWFDNNRRGDFVRHVTIGFDFDFTELTQQGLQFPNQVHSVTWEDDIPFTLTNAHFKGNLTHLTFGWNFNQPIDALRGLINLTHLTFGRVFNQHVDALRGLINLTHLTFGWYFNQPTDGLSGLVNLTHLTFGGFFNQPVDAFSGLINLTHLTFGHNFNQPIDALSGLVKLTHLEFGYYFKQPIDALSGLVNLTHLTFREKFNQPIDALGGLINLTHLTFGWHFNQPIDVLRGLISLTHLTFGRMFNQDVNLLPLVNLTDLRIDAHSNRIISVVPGVKIHIEK